MNVWSKHLLKSAVIAVVFSIILLMIGTIGVTFYSLLNELDLNIPKTYNISVDPRGSFEISMGPGIFFTFLILTAFFTLTFFLGQLYADTKKRT
ncbi:MAG: hypothetical protein CW342_14575 [Thermoactinomycetaceae bacterium]|nr:hypothetical protein [Thermoactinomycetaceae bacterium]